jgi:propionyl-CoA carboxylase alpha chain
LISSLLVANRGEIARRIFRTCRQAGIAAVAVCSDPDSSAPHAAEADVTVRLPGSAPAQTYLNGPAIVAAALAAGADAVHPGYGFLAEDAGFARSVLSAGLTWVGPPPEAIEAMGLKITAKKLAADAGVPVLPGLDPAAVTEFPVLVKASAGGGGRGMRVVSGPGELAAAVQSASAEAQSAFGDGTVFCEPLLTGARHVEVQVLADAAGTVWALTERDCSVQRRYQKVIEETPSPAVRPALRRQLLAAARAVTAAVRYLGAGTAEFLLAQDGRFFFLEFNTRLQVEHPVTECVYGIDLVALQLDIAQGLPLPAAPPAAVGHAIEARLYAEEPASGYRPSAGTVHAFAVPGTDTRFAAAVGRRSPYLRLDAGIETGSEVSPYYDAMLAKLIAWAPGRDAAARRLAAALAGATIHGPASNAALLVSVLRGAAFRSGGADTSLLDRMDLAGLAPGERACRLSALAAAVAAAARNQQAAQVTSAAVGGWRNVLSQPQHKAYDSPCGRVDAAYLWTRQGIEPADHPTGQAAAADQPEAGRVTAADQPEAGRVTAADQPEAGRITAADQPEAGRITAADQPEAGRITAADQPEAGRVTAADGAAGGSSRPTVVAFRPDQVILELAGVRYRFDVASYGGTVWVDSPLGQVRLVPVPRLPEPAPSREPGSLIAPIPGNVVRVEATQGTAVAAGQPVLVVEAMKMEHQIAAPAAGVIAELRVAPGDQVAAGDVLAIVTAAGQTAEET